MLLAREFVSYISRQIVRRLSPTWIEVSDLAAAGATIVQLPPLKRFIDRLDDVRPLLAAAKEELLTHTGE